MFDEHEKQTDDLGVGFHTVFQLMAVGMALVLFVVGLVMAFGVFNIVRDTMMSPENFARILDAWAEPVRDPETDPETPPLAENLPAEVESPGDAVSTEPDVQDADSDADEDETEAPSPFVLPTAESQDIPEQSASFWSTLDQFMEALREQDMSRAAGGFIIFLFLFILAKLAVEVLSVGANLMTHVLKRNEKK
jgi:hypothetical protein